MPSCDCHQRAWRLHKEEVRRFLAHRCGCAAEADDLLQEVFLRVVVQGAAFCRVENSRAWLLQVARNLLIDRLRLTKAQVPLPDDLSAEAPQEIEPVDLLSHCLPRVLSELSPEDRAAIVSCDIEGMTQKTFAERQGLSLPAAKSRVLRARSRLRAQLSEACRLEFDEQGKVCSFVPRPPLKN
jgi:RNA polymerase sigma-70 factor (ECF subfamily)